MNTKKRAIPSPIQLFLLAIALVCAVAHPAAAQKATPWRAKNVQAVESWTQAQRAQAAGDTNVWIARGVVANRTTHQVQAVAEATGLDNGAIVEFLVVGETSEKDYEALAVSLARASDLAHALEFIGMPRGRPINAALCQFWAKGERVTISVRPVAAAETASRPLAACLLDKRTTQPLPTAFIYAGSRWSGDAAHPACRADDSAPGAMVSTYNEPTVLLDVPEDAPQSEVYGNLVVAPAGVFAGGTPLLLTFTPEARTDGLARVVDVSLEVHPGPTALIAAPAATNTVLPGAASLGALVCVTRGTGPSCTTNDLAGALNGLEALTKAGRDPFVTVSLDETLTVATARDLARVLKSVDGPGGIRVDPPPEGQLFYRAFLPDEAWRTRSARMAQPWELRLGRGPDGAWHYMLVQVVEDWSKPGKLEPELTVKEHPLARWEDLPATIKVLGGGLNTLFVFAPAAAPLSAIMPAVRLVHATQPVAFVFCD